MIRSSRSQPTTKYSPFYYIPWHHCRRKHGSSSLLFQQNVREYGDGEKCSFESCSISKWAIVRVVFYQLKPYILWHKSNLKVYHLRTRKIHYLYGTHDLLFRSLPTFHYMSNGIYDLHEILICKLKFAISNIINIHHTKIFIYSWCIMYQT